MPRRRRTTKLSWVITLLVLALFAYLYIQTNAGKNLGLPGTGGTPNITLPTIIVPTISGNVLPTSSTPEFGQQTKTSGCAASGGLPDPQCTPGAIFSVSTAEICRSGYASSVRNVTESEKQAVYAEYGIRHHTTGQYEVDHLVSLELGGSNDISNLWPEAASPKPGFHEKDDVENYLHDQVCSGHISLAEAQKEIATNWLQIYNQIH